MPFPESVWRSQSVARSIEPQKGALKIRMIPRFFPAPGAVGSHLATDSDHRTPVGDRTDAQIEAGTSRPPHSTGKHDESRAHPRRTCPGRFRSRPAAAAGRGGWCGASAGPAPSLAGASTTTGRPAPAVARNCPRLTSRRTTPPLLTRSLTRATAVIPAIAAPPPSWPSWAELFNKNGNHRCFRDTWRSSS